MFVRNRRTMLTKKFGNHYSKFVENEGENLDRDSIECDRIHEKKTFPWEKQCRLLQLQGVMMIYYHFHENCTILGASG